MFPEIDYNRCINCKVCVDICPYEVFGEEEDRVSVVSPENCIECGECVRNCENQAIRLVE